MMVIKANSPLPDHLQLMMRKSEDALRESFNTIMPYLTEMKK